MISLYDLDGNRAELRTHPAMQTLADRAGTLAILVFLTSHKNLAADLLELQWRLFGGLVLTADEHHAGVDELNRIRDDWAEQANLSRHFRN